jgi:hypothetical protein
MQGMYTPDVAELIKPSIAVYLMKLAVDNNIDAALTIPNEEEEEQMTDDTFFDVIKQRNPSMYAKMVEVANEQERMGKADLERYMAEERGEQQQPASPPQNFIEMGDV